MSALSGLAKMLLQALSEHYQLVKGANRSLRCKHYMVPCRSFQMINRCFEKVFVEGHHSPSGSFGHLLGHPNMLADN